MQRRLLIIDDEENMLHMLSAMLKKAGFVTDSCQSGEDGLEQLKQNEYDFVLCDVKMPGIGGLQFLKEAVTQRPDITVIMMSAFGSMDMAIEAMKAGAYDFISKPFKKDEVILCLKKAEEREKLRGENRRLKQEIASYRGIVSFTDMIWKSDLMTNVVDLATKAAAYESTVLVTGESGTGKEVLAKAIHEISARKDEGFYAINCGSIPAGLLESELFGHIKGAFTGAEQSKKGIFQEADKATLLLDEIGELPLEMQVKLLRVLQENEIKAVGSNTVQKIDVRVLAATSKDLEKEVKEGRFRQDLFYRLNVIHIIIPPLRKRPEDIPFLVDHFIKKYNEHFQKKVKGISPHCIDQLLQHQWPGNIRELENVVQRAFVLTEKDFIDDVLIGHSVADRPSVENSLNKFELDNIWSIKDAQKKVESYLIDKALEKTDGNKSQAARLLEISYPSLLQKIKGYNL